jgi:predicted ATPase
MPALPSGTIALLVANVEELERFRTENEAATLAALRRQEALLRKVIEGRGGVLFKNSDEAVFAAFVLPRDALTAAIEGQKRLQAERTKAAGSVLPVRMALHIGTPERRMDEYAGLSLRILTRLGYLGQGGQILASRAFHEMVRSVMGIEVEFQSTDAWQLPGTNQAETVYQVRASSLPSEFPPLGTGPELIGNLPVLSSSFIGRARFLTQLTTQIEQHGLATLYGAGGCGKTRLAIEAARPLAAGFPGGAWLVQLEGRGGEQEVIARETIRALQICASPGQNPEQILIAHFREQPALILLDHADHLAEDCSRFAQTLRSACPDLRILVTSRTPLSAPGEFIREVPPLPLPRGIGKLTPSAIEASEAIQLFVARAEASNGLTLTRQNAASVTDICRALDGIPLALELAAAWAEEETLDEITEEIVARFNEPPGDNEAANIRLRRRTMQGIIDWSFRRLLPVEQAFFLTLSVLAGGFTREDACAVAGEVAIDPDQALRSLTARSLITLDETAAREPRYRLQEMVRELALEKLTGTVFEQSARDRHRALAS